ncbi:MAG: mevalonate kinase [Cardiobacteriaceae bacterium]|nr:mevalonate kinase [Cardiobacteriaceae bacterium]
MLESSAPASLMICGEHAVVYGYDALVLAVSERIKVRLKPRTDKRVIIQSALANHETSLSELIMHPQLSFVMQSIVALTPSSGFELSIDSEINPNMGLGSSAAVVIATLGALAHYHQSALLNDKQSFHRLAHQVILKVQGRGSGADLAAALLGGLVAYSPQGASRFSTLPLPPKRLSVRYAGYKTKTADVLAMLAERAEQNPKHFADLYARMGQVSGKALWAAGLERWEDFYGELNGYQGLMEELGVCDEVQRRHIQEALAVCDAVKISGSGLGDCIIALGDKIPDEHQEVIPTMMGLRIDE